MSRAALLLALVGCASAPTAPETVFSSGSQDAAAPFALQPGDVGPSALVDRWTLVVVGWLRCPDVCPAALSGIARALDDDPALEAWFVSIDPEHDRERLHDQVTWYHERIRPLTAEPEQLAPAVASWGLAWSPDGDGFEHSTSAVLFDPAGRIAGYVLQPSDPVAVQAAVERARAAYEPPASLWMRPAPPNARVLAAFGTLHRPVTGLDSPTFDRVELHETTVTDGMARMERRFEAPAGTVMEPGGWHLMLYDWTGDAPLIRLTHGATSSWVRPQWR